MNRSSSLLLAVLAVSLLLVADAARFNCNQMACGTGSCCNDNKLGAICFNPNQYDCATDNLNNLVLCSKGNGACNGACFDSKNYHCTANGIAQGSVAKTSAAATSASPQTSTSVPKTSTSAAASSSTPVTTSAYCKAGTCGAGVSCCGMNLCYSPASYSCVYDALLGRETLCPIGFRSCKGGCYDPNVYSCKDSGLALGRETSQDVQTSAAATSATPKTSTSAAATSNANPGTSGVIVNPIPVPSSGNLPTQTADLRIINNCKYTLWIEGRYGGKGAPIPDHSSTSTKAAPGGYVDYTIPATGLSGTRFWAKYGCDSTGRNCKMGDQMQYYPEGGCPPTGCTPPIDSLFEATFGCKPGSNCATSNPTTWFDTSQVDGYTIPYKVTLNGENNKCDCTSSGCGLKTIDASRLDLGKCPSSENLTGGGRVTSQGGKSLTSVDLRLIDEDTNSIIGCISPCKKLSWQWGLSEATSPTLYYCCPTPNPANCQISQGCITSEGCRNGPVINTQFVNSIHSMAPGIYTYAYDDGVGLHACPAGTVTYTMEFCPAGSSPYPHPI